MAAAMVTPMVHRGCEGKRLDCRTRFEYIGKRPVSQLLGRHRGAPVRVIRGLINNCQNFTVTRIEQYRRTTLGGMVLDRPGEAAIGNVLQTHIYAGINIVTRFGGFNLGQFFDNLPTSVADYATLARLRAQPVLINQFQSFLPMVIDIGKSDQMRYDFPGRVVAMVLALQINPIDTRGDRACKLRFELAFSPRWEPVLFPNPGSPI